MNQGLTDSHTDERRTSSTLLPIVGDVITTSSETLEKSTPEDAMKFK